MKHVTLTFISEALPNNKHDLDSLHPLILSALF